MSSSSSTSSGQKKRLKLQDDDLSLASQSEVVYDKTSKDNTQDNNSPRAVGARNKSVRSENQLYHTPVRVMKRHVSSPMLNAAKHHKPSENNRFFDQIAETSLEENQLKLSDEELTFNFDDEDVKAQVKLDKLEIMKDVQSQPTVASFSSDKSLIRTTHGCNLDDSFDALLGSMPLENLLKKNSSSPTIKQIVSAKPTLTKQITVTNNPVQPLLQPRAQQSKNLERHNSMPTQMQTKRKINCLHIKSHLFQSLVISPPAILPQPTQEQKRLCTPAEIEQKRRAALEKLKKNRQILNRY